MIRIQISKWQLVVAFTVVIATSLIAIGIRGQPHRVAPSYVSQDVPGPVLLVPGYGGSTAALKVLAGRLQAAGRVAVVVPAIGDGTGDLRLEAAQLQSTANAQINSGVSSVDVVGYSAGGVIVRIWEQELGGARVTRRVVTLGSPHHGTKTAKLGQIFGGASCALACRQLVPGSDLLDQLDEATDGPRWTSIWTAEDTVVTPPDTARLDHAVNIDLEKICPDSAVTHAGLPTDPLVVGLVLKALAVAPLTVVPHPQDCTSLRAAGT